MEKDHYREVDTEAEMEESLNVLSLRRLGYDFENNQLLLEGEGADLESMSGYKTDLFDVPTVSEIGQVEGAMVGAAGHVFVAESLLSKADEFCDKNPDRLEVITSNVSDVMRQSFDSLYPELLENVDVSDDLLWGFQLGVRDGGVPTLVTFGQCACLGYDPHGIELGLPIQELSFHNIDTRVNERLGKAQLTSLFAGLAAYSEFIQAE